MKFKTKKLLAISLQTLILASGLFLTEALPSLAQTTPPTPQGQDVSALPARCRALYNQFTIGTSTNQTNILGNLPIYCTASGTILIVINYGLIMAGSVAILFLIIGGFWYLTSAGNDEQNEKGKKTLMNAVIGLGVIILSGTIVRIVASTLSLGK